jgi:hypothetical protein
MCPAADIGTSSVSQVFSQAVATHLWIQLVGVSVFQLLNVSRGQLSVGRLNVSAFTSRRALSEGGWNTRLRRLSIGKSFG